MSSLGMCSEVHGCSGTKTFFSDTATRRVPDGARSNGWLAVTCRFCHRRSKRPCQGYMDKCRQSSAMRGFTTYRGGGQNILKGCMRVGGVWAGHKLPRCEPVFLGIYFGPYCLQFAEPMESSGVYCRRKPYLVHRVPSIDNAKDALPTMTC